MVNQADYLGNTFLRVPACLWRGYIKRKSEPQQSEVQYSYVERLLTYTGYLGHHRGIGKLWIYVARHFSSDSCSRGAHARLDGRVWSEGEILIEIQSM